MTPTRMTMTKRAKSSRRETPAENERRHKRKVPSLTCLCPIGGTSTSCKVKNHKTFAQILQSVGLDPSIRPFQPECFDTE